MLLVFSTLLGGDDSPMNWSHWPHSFSAEMTASGQSVRRYATKKQTAASCHLRDGPQQRVWLTAPLIGGCPRWPKCPMTCYEKRKENISAPKGRGQEDKRESKQRFFCFVLVLFIASTPKGTDSSQPSVSIWIPLDGNAGWGTNAWLISFFLSFFLFFSHIITFTFNC